MAVNRGNRAGGASRPALILLTALAPVSWGTTYAVTTEFLPADRPLFTGLMRALPAGLLLLAVALPHHAPRGSTRTRASSSRPAGRARTREVNSGRSAGRNSVVTA